jgi:hypothetical protein
MEKMEFERISEMDKFIHIYANSMEVLNATMHQVSLFIEIYFSMKMFEMNRCEHPGTDRRSKLPKIHRFSRL